MQIKLMKTIFALALALTCCRAEAMPTRAELKKVQGLVNELMASDMQAMKAGKMKAPEVAAKAESYARDAETEAAKFLFLKGAFGLYMQGEDYGEALRVLNELPLAVKDVPDKVMAEIVGTRLKRLNRSKGAEIFEYYARLNQRITMSAERDKLEKALKANPKSKEAQRDLAVCLAVLGDWKNSLAHFAEAGGKEAEAAGFEKSGKRAAAADLWWEVAQGDASDVLKSHAADLYRQAIEDGKLKGLKLTLAQKRIAEVTPAAPCETSVASNPSEAAKATPRRTCDAPVAPKMHDPAVTRHAKCDWSIPADFKGGIRTVELDLGCPEKMTFFAVPPGECGIPDGGFIHVTRPFKFAVTRPFWISQFCVTVGQFESLGFNCQDQDLSRLVEASKNDRSVAVRTAVTIDESERFYELMNQKFGQLLPKGLVFRPYTIAEYRRACWWTLEMNFRDAKAQMSVSARRERSIRRFEAYRKKGFFGDCDNVEEMLKKKNGWSPTRWQLDSLEDEYARIRDAREVSHVLFLRCCQLDAISAPGLSESRNQYAREYVASLNRLLRGNLKMFDPFWYCEKGAPSRLVAAQETFYSERLHFPSFFIRVAVGHDYVGEWKRAHGK